MSDISKRVDQNLQTEIFEEKTNLFNKTLDEMKKRIENIGNQTEQ